ncbi:hypothetical protein AnigIFM56816_005272 [Aspergillus niger]|uniref:SnoaL-domain-containing protein n=1 Tax=Aspergillus welwitschiae TaxID=1341132 RepID=A0A3F3PPD2_9EURO|nr:hypothetical protein BDQ94DRAFT_151751 [Aspergillus welwitschiae]RDH28688.1 hypothetical protein BDQ94DRAFT_151751 [Aspergillus welwitschiae]GKZ76293.1 hypothetical protein AnigIFM56816_005272 [Aspergillus niger]
MSIDLRQKMSRFVEFINSNDETVGKEVVSESAEFHVPFSDTPLKGLAGYMQILGIMRGAYPDIHWSLNETVVEGNKLVAQFTIRGTHEGEFFGIPASGKQINTFAMNMYRFEDGKIVEERGLPDLFGMMVQIGAIQPPQPR